MQPCVQAMTSKGIVAVNGDEISKADVDRLTAQRDAAAARVGVAQAQLGELRREASDGSGGGRHPDDVAGVAVDRERVPAQADEDQVEEDRHQHGPDDQVGLPPGAPRGSDRCRARTDRALLQG